MYARIVTNRENFRFRIDDVSKGKWSHVCDIRGMKQQQMMEALVSWFLAEEDNQDAVLKHDRLRREKAAETPAKGGRGGKTYRGMVGERIVER